MEERKMFDYIKNVLDNMPADWLNLTTHRLDIYDESQAKVQFIEQFGGLFKSNNSSTTSLSELPTAYDYIRLGHPLSCVLEWTIANIFKQQSDNVISFSSSTTPLLAVLRKNLFDKRNTRIVYNKSLPPNFDAEVLRNVYGYKFDLIQHDAGKDISKFQGSTIYISIGGDFDGIKLQSNIDFHLSVLAHIGSILLVNGKENESYISEIQHVRRRETIAMTPDNCLKVLRSLVDNSSLEVSDDNIETNKTKVLGSIREVNGSNTKAVVGSSGLSIQYAIMMGLIHDAMENHKGKAIKFIVPPNCYGGTNDQARRVAACLDNVDVVDLPVDAGNDMVQSVDTVLNSLALEDAVPYIIAEIPTNPRVEVPDLIKLKEALSKVRKTPAGEHAIDPVFILDQTFCPNVHFLGEGKILSTVRTISYASGSKFPSGGRCTAGYCIGNKKTEFLMDKIEQHLSICDNEATHLQYGILAEQMPSMIKRISEAYTNTREFVNFIQEKLPSAKINFVSEELAEQGFTPSVFSLDLPTKGDTVEEKEKYKRALNHKLINMMITEIPDESKYCVSYGQLKGCYWTIPATSTQGTTKEGDKDYIARVALSANMDLEMHKRVFSDFVDCI